jgi:hypothetical protein
MIANTIHASIDSPVQFRPQPPRQNQGDFSAVCPECAQAPTGSQIPAIPNLQSVPRLFGSFVYFLSHKGTVVYVGKSKDLFGRASQHAKKEFDTLHYLAVPALELDATEAHWIKTLSPRYNIENNDHAQFRHDCPWSATGVTNLVQYKHSGVYFCRAMVGGKQVRASLKTKDFETAKARLSEHLKEKREELQRYCREEAR